MLTYHQWDLIADAYIPILASFSLIILWCEAKQHGSKSTLQSIFSVGLSISFIYLMMFIDRALELWPTFGLDYSTHTALALVFVVFVGLRNIRFSVISVISMLLYAGLMMYQAYHSLLDILTTAFIVVPVIYWLQNTSLQTKKA
ncbi:MAG: hypothetical protein U9R28_06300 [Pseudomonadota bacterium]|nr:hypothetical protein [Pseudomonadota bacterium]